MNSIAWYSRRQHKVEKLLFIAHRLPFPPNKGDKIRAFNILKHLSSRFEIHLAALVDDVEDLDQYMSAKNAVASLAVARVTRVSRIWKAVLAIATGRSISQSAFYVRKLQKHIDSLHREHDFDIVFCSSSPIAEYVFRSTAGIRESGRSIRIMDFIDIDSEKWMQYAQESMWPLKYIFAREGRCLSAFEGRIGSEFDALLAVSEQEAALYSPEGHSAKITAVGNGVDLDFFSPAAAGEKIEPFTLVFVGMMNYRPNIEGAAWFIESVFPAVQAKYPSARLVIVGGKPTALVRSWSKIDGIDVTGFVDDVRTYVHRAALSVAPLRIARGIQNKVLESMAMAKAVVATPQAAEGINATRGDEIVIADSGEQFAAAVNELLAQPERAHRIGVQARRRMEETYSWQRQLQPLDRLIGGLCAADNRTLQRADREV